MRFTHEHQELQRTAQQIIDKHINPYVDEWEAAGMYPAHEVFKRLGGANAVMLEIIAKELGTHPANRNKC
ncbi:acyl-CoA dehydrogenase family protein [Marinobacter litoralis]|uniref:acyl-CoA dehydrogenase family protein n=1 Tax=Marinobacter litoralis TaxID=187981 RepID=UPI0018EB5695|nr:acyl-CoA dehydrogenase family protein [Marinobacter litoralis]MBJ6136076.1 acyl-CoA dehydrogenase family protein [Marinobacter litoralis]